MKKIIQFITTLCVVMTVFFSTSFAQVEKSGESKKQLEKVCYTAEVKCDNCKGKIEKSIPFEKGVKDVVVSVKDKTVTITFLKSKTDKEALKKAIEKLGIKVSKVTVL